MLWTTWGTDGASRGPSATVSGEERCYVHDPVLVVSHSSPNLMWCFSLVTLAISVACMIVITTLPSPSSSTCSDIGMDIFYHDRVTA
ncbi:hypothetical protein Hamer_G023768 [Homarus americanus]|uniref:Uncharacterized protein n=1 Tax=Homarus americanus TaxID=6706 RepID=A0A8J5JHT0_HOMAM|nr:hypothetical protein Hamer_G023768 [Homarus americanus]